MRTDSTAGVFHSFVMVAGSLLLAVGLIACGGEAPEGDVPTVSGPDAAQSSCKAEYPVSQGPTEPCCPNWGKDACGAGLFCAAFDGRTQPTCYAEHSRQVGETCTADRQCASKACNTEVEACRARKRQECDPSVGCVEGYVCVADDRDPSSEDFSCEAVGEGVIGSLCASDDDCRRDAYVCYQKRCHAADCDPSSDNCDQNEECLPSSDGNRDWMLRCRPPDGDRGADCTQDPDCDGSLICSEASDSCTRPCSGDSDCSSDLDCHPDLNICVDSAWVDECQLAFKRAGQCCEIGTRQFDAETCVSAYSARPETSDCQRGDLECIRKIYAACGVNPPDCEISKDCKQKLGSPGDRQNPCGR